MFFLLLEPIPFLFLPYWYSYQSDEQWCVSSERPLDQMPKRIHCMFCPRVACFTFHCPSPPIPSSFQHCCSVLQHCTLPTACFLLWQSLEAMWMSHSANTPPADFLLYTGHCTPGRERAVQRCSISARSEPFQRLLRPHCRAWLSSAVQTSEMHASDDKVCSANSLNQIHCRASLRCLQMAPVFKWTTISNPRQ